MNATDPALLDERCPKCGTRYADAVALARCAYEDALVAQLVAYGDTQPLKPTPTEVRDLYAHLRRVRDDGTESARLVRKVLDLGWRPVSLVALDGEGL